MSRKIFVTGTDTGVGKTLISLALVATFRSRGLTVGVMKPIETGCEENSAGVLIALDATDLHKASNAHQMLNEVILYRYRSPVAPAIAEKHETPAIDIEGLHRAIETQSKKCDVLLVEGAGGLLVPVSENYTFANLAKDLQMEVVVVVGSKLGALNHTALTFETLRSRGIHILGYVRNEPYDCAPNTTTPTDATRSNAAALRDIAIQYEVPLLGECDFLAEGAVTALRTKGILPSELTINAEALQQ